MNNIMLDIETLGTSSNSIIVSIAAVAFNFKDDITEDLLLNCSPKSSKALGMVSDADTVQWWAEQPAEVRNAWMVDQRPITDALTTLSEFAGTQWKNVVWWSNGMNFDFPVLEWSYKAATIPVPWKYWNLRDVRTVYSVFDLNFREFPRVGKYHNAIDDCKTQIAALKSVLI